MAQSEPKDIMSSIDISIEDQTTMHARMSTLIQVFVWTLFETAATDLAGVSWVHQQNVCVPGTLSLGTYHSYEGGPPSIGNTFIQSSLRRSTIRNIGSLCVLLRSWASAHLGRLQLLKHDGFVAVHQQTSVLVVEVLALSSHLAMTVGDTFHRFLAPVAPS